jgi:phosphoglucosamine mutase
VPLEQLPDVLRIIAQVERELGDDGRVLVRYSGTESKARVMIEGMDEVRIRGWAEEIAGVLARSCRA